MTTTIRGTDNSAAAPALTGNDSDTGIYFPAANMLGLVTGGTERVSVTSTGNVAIANGNLVFSTNGTGIDFSASAGGGASSSLLDDYEEGTFTPTLTADVNPTGTTYNGQVGRYTKIGRMVHIEISLAINSKGTGGSGNAYVSGLPFTAATVTGNFPNFGIAMSPVTSSLTGEITGQINTGDNKVTLVYNTNTTSVLNAIPLSSIANSSDIRTSFCYLV